MRNLKRMSAFVLCVLLLFGFTSCQGEGIKQLRDQALVQGIGIDMAESGFEVTFQVLDTSKAGVSASETKGNITTTFSSTGKSISAAIANGQKVLDRDTFLAQNKVIVISEEVATRHMEQVLDFFIRSKNCRPDVRVALTKESAKEVMESKCRETIIPAEKIQNMLENGEYNGKSENILIMDVVNDYKNPVSGVYLPVVKLIEKGDNVALDGIAVFDSDYQVGYLNDRETRGVLWSHGKVTDGTLLINSEKLGQVTLEILSSRAKPHIAVTEDGRIHFSLDVICSSTINEMENGIEYRVTAEDLKEFEKKAENLVRSEINAALEKCLKTYGCDVFHMGRLLSQREYDFYQQIKEDYVSQLPLVKYDVSVHTQIKRLDNDTAGK